MAAVRAAEGADTEAQAMTTISKKQNSRTERLCKGLCPDCGKDAAPYRQCSSCRFNGVLRRCLRKGRASGALKSERDPKDGRQLRWWIKKKNSDWQFRSAYDKDDWQQDGRTRPRLGKVPIDVATEIYGILEAFQRPACEDEIIAAWGRLREDRHRASLTSDMVALITAQRRREERFARRAIRQA